MRDQSVSLAALRKVVEERVCEAVEGVLKQVPDGERYRGQFRQAIGGALDMLQQQVQGQMKMDTLSSIGEPPLDRLKQHPPQHDTSPRH